MQKGSLVAGDRLRFDFAHPKPISEDELAEVADIANRMVLQNSAVTTRLMGVDDAIASGARALFGEKYGDEVRVVSMGALVGGDNAGRAFSVELCGGNHVELTGAVSYRQLTPPQNLGLQRHDDALLAIITCITRQFVGD